MRSSARQSKPEKERRKKIIQQRQTEMKRLHRYREREKKTKKKEREKKNLYRN